MIRNTFFWKDAKGIHLDSTLDSILIVHPEIALPADYLLEPVSLINGHEMLLALPAPTLYEWVETLDLVILIQRNCSGTT